MSGGQILDFYSRPTEMTRAGELAEWAEALPEDIEALVRVVQGLGVYDVVASDFYAFTVPEERKPEIHIRHVRALLARLRELDSRPLAAARPVDKRIVGRCRTFQILLVAFLRAKGVAARARCGFGTYFNPGYFEDHWVCEYWDRYRARWVRVDAQLDAVWRERLKIDFDPLDVPRDRFLTAGDAWEKCRRGEADPERFGIHFVPLRGLWFVAGNLVRDLAALNLREMLPWDVWGAQPGPEEVLDDRQLAYFDALAPLSRDPEAHFAELRERFAEEGLRVPPTVFNALCERTEAV